MVATDTTLQTKPLEIGGTTIFSTTAPSRQIEGTQATEVSIPIEDEISEEEEQTSNKVEEVSDSTTTRALDNGPVKDSDNEMTKASNNRTNKVSDGGTTKDSDREMTEIKTQTTFWNKTCHTQVEVEMTQYNNKSRFLTSAAGQCAGNTEIITHTPDAHMFQIRRIFNKGTWTFRADQPL